MTLAATAQKAILAANARLQLLRFLNTSICEGLFPYWVLTTSATKIPLWVDAYKICNENVKKKIFFRKTDAFKKRTDRKPANVNTAGFFHEIGIQSQEQWEPSFRSSFSQKQHCN